MDTYRRYQQARDTAWRALLRLEHPALPVDAEELAHLMGAEVHDRAEGRREAHLARLLDRLPGSACVSLHVKGQWHLFAAPGLDAARRRFAVAHELGHILLSHDTRLLAPGVRAFQSLENDGDLLTDPDSLDDYAADIFAIRLLAPACVLHDLHADTPGAIARLCGLPPRAAALRAERMELLNRRDAYFTHPLERQVRERFLPAVRAQAFPPPARPVLPAVIPHQPEEAEPELPGPAGRRLYWAAGLLGAAAAGICAYLLLR